MDMTSYHNTDAEVAYDLAYLEHLEEANEDAPKQKRQPSDNPIKMWMPYQDLYLQEFINLDGRGDKPTDVCPDCTQLPAGEAKY
ncbi:hypothetical protein C0992_011596 [Termitomyces sp. T32_za158]|nr:hypothetical protein C0992_011596 [Termitomyces sp. T32_za158]